MLAQSVEFDCQIQYMSIDFSRDTNSVHLIRSCSFAIIFNPLIFPKPCLTFLSPPHQLSLIDSCQEEQSPSNPIESVCHYFQPPPLLFKITSLGANSTRGVLLGILGGGLPSGSPNYDPFYFRPMSFCHFSHTSSDQTAKIHTRFQTWPLGRNYFVIT